MRLPSLITHSLLSCLPLFAACAFEDDTGPTPYDEEFPLSSTDPTEGAPANDSLPDDNKADAHYPAKFEIGFQSPVKSQGSRRFERGASRSDRGGVMSVMGVSWPCAGRVVAVLHRRAGWSRRSGAHSCIGRHVKIP